VALTCTVVANSVAAAFKFWFVWYGTQRTLGLPYNVFIVWACQREQTGPVHCEVVSRLLVRLVIGL